MLSGFSPKQIDGWQVPRLEYAYPHRRSLLDWTANPIVALSLDLQLPDGVGMSDFRMISGSADCIILEFCLVKTLLTNKLSQGRFADWEAQH